MTDKIKHVTDASFQQDVLESELPVIVDFWALWCGPCRMMAPVFEDLAEEYDGRLTFVKMNVDENPDTPGKWAILSIPTLIIYVDGEQADRLIGFMRKPVFKQKIDAALARIGTE